MRTFDGKMNYYKIDHTGTKKAVTYDEALHVLLGTYKDNDTTREMLTVAGEIPCMFSTIMVEEAA